MRSFVLLFVAAAVLAEGDEFERVSLRVISTDPVLIDRGSRDGLAIGDPVTFTPRGGGTFGGVIIELSERTAVVELHDAQRKPEPGTPGEVRVPKSRFVEEPAEGGEAETEKKDGAGDEPKEGPADGWTPEKPLLSGMRPVRPKERPFRMNGRVYAIASLASDIDGYLDNSLVRVGSAVRFENPFGQGGTLRIDGEFSFLTNQIDEEGLDLVLRRLSYVWRGTRFDTMRAEGGRFLQHGMPEFGILDGVEWSQRSAGGDRYGVSFGWMPEPDQSFNAFQDVQFAAFYEFVASVEERLTATAGYQKTWHEGEADRDLLVLRVRHMPESGWKVHGTVWIDFYFGNEAVKSGVDFTRALITAFRRWASGSGLDVTYTRQRFPDILRNEYTPVSLDELANGAYDRIALDGFTPGGPGRRWRAHLSGWHDDDGNGGTAEVGLELEDLFLPFGRGEVTLFGVLGKFEDQAGIRVVFGRYVAAGHWEVLYEFAQHRMRDFDADVDDLPQHRVRVNAGMAFPGGWDASAHAEAILFDGEISWSIGLYVQKRF